jgi:hypothetical protein
MCSPRIAPNGATWETMSEMGCPASPKRALEAVMRAVSLASVVLVGSSCTRTDGSSPLPGGGLGDRNLGFPAQSGTDPSDTPPAGLSGGETPPAGTGLLPLLCPVCGPIGGGDTTDFNGYSEDPNANNGCWDEEPAWMGLAEARGRGFSPEPDNAELEGEWAAPIRWITTERQTQLRFTIERTGRVLVFDRYPSPDAGTPKACPPSVYEEFRVSLGADDGSIQGQLAAIAGGSVSPTYRRVSFFDSGVELRGNLELDIDWERQPRALHISLDWFHFESELEDRMSVVVDVRYAVLEGQNDMARAAQAEPADGCLNYELPWEGGCVAIWNHPAHGHPRRDAGVNVQPVVPQDDASVPIPASESRDAGSSNEPANAGVVPASDAGG